LAMRFQQPNQFCSGKAFIIVCTLFIVAQFVFFYKTNPSLALTDPLYDEPEAAAGNTCDQTMVGDDTPCSAILTGKICEFREDCFAIYGTQCGSVLPDKTFLECVPTFEARRAKKMQLPKRIPQWSSGHPDFDNICAHDPNVPDKLYRFDRFIPTDWTQKECNKCSIHPPQLPPTKGSGLSLVALVYREFDSFNNAVRSWNSSGLLDYADETILWMNAKQEGDDPIEDVANEFGLRVIGSPTNLGIGAAIAKLVLEAKGPYVIFLEKDWEVVEPRKSVIQQLEYAKRLLSSQVNGSRADAVKLRSKRNAGYPNIDPALCIPPEYDEQELNEWSQFRWFEELNDHQWWLPHLFCNLVHYRADADLLRIYPNRVWRCGAALCFDSAQCGWTNNPIIFNKHWFLDTLYKISQYSEDPTFEGGTYYTHEWIDPHWVIAQTEGFFMHHEINEHL